MVAWWRCSHCQCLLLLWSLQVLWQQLASVTALVFAAALRRIQEVQAQMDLQPRCDSWMVQGHSCR